MVDVPYLDLLPGQVRLAEAVGEQFFRDVAVLLADLDVKAFRLAVDNAGLCQRLTTRKRQQ
ncbi:hypothetical protein D3C86_2192510 [compost metagenome]